MNPKIKTTQFENVYYYNGYHIMISNDNKDVYVSQKVIYFSNNCGDKEYALENAVHDIDKIIKERADLYTNIQKKLVRLAETDLTQIIFNATKSKE